MSAARTLLATVIAFVAVENLIFNTGLYAKIINPDSTTGFLELRLWNEQKRPVHDRNQVLAIGDSRMGFFPRYADQIKSEVGYTFASISTAGTTPRCWYYMLRDADPTARRYAAILIPVYGYDDQEIAEHSADRETDMHYLVARLRWSDLIPFSQSFDSPSLKLRAAIGVALKGSIYKTDFQDLLMHRRQRLEYADLSRRESFGWYYDYVGSEDNVAGVKVDWTKKTFELPPRLAGEKDIFQDVLFPYTPATTRQERYLKTWLGKIYDYYRGSGTKLILFRLPRGAYVRPNPPRYNPHSSVRELARQPDVILDDEHYFDFLEKPELFMDPVHLNAPGCGEFSRALARRVRELLGPPHAL